jgi:hypothetical protein
MTFVKLPNHVYFLLTMVNESFRTQMTASDTFNVQRHSENNGNQCFAFGDINTVKQTLRPPLCILLLDAWLSSMGNSMVSSTIWKKNMHE